MADSTLPDASPKIDGRSSPERRARIAALNAATKRKYPVGSDTRSRIYRIWRAMHMRCYQRSHEAFDRYGGRGILICAEWHDFDSFRRWAIETGYADNLTIDRRDNEKGYEPGNCRWATLRAQQSNKRDNVSVTAFGETKTVAEWARDPRCSVARGPLYRRVRQGRDPEWAITGAPRSDVRRQPLSEATKQKISDRAKVGQRDRGRDESGRFV